MGPFLLVDKNQKTVRLEDLPKDAWTWLVGGPNQAPDLRKYYKEVAWLNRGVRLRANHVSRVPFKIMRGETEIDNSNDYQGRLPFLPNPKRMLWLIESSLTMSGAAYNAIDRKAMGGKGVPYQLRHMVSTSITPRYAKPSDVTAGNADVVGDLMYFVRNTGFGTVKLDPADVVYFWAPDDEVEIGPPKSYPALAALLSAGVLYAVSNFANTFFERGAIKVTLLATKGPVVPSERSRLKEWWDRIRGDAWAAEVINADELMAIPVGEGLESLENTDLTTEQREDVATALGVPHSMLFSNAANYATSQQDKLNFYEDTIIPECEPIQETINEQLLGPLGFRWVFMPDQMAIFQEDEEQRSSSMYNLVGAGWRPSIAAETLGYDLPDGVDYAMLDERYNVDLEARQTVANPISPQQDEEEIKPPDQALEEGDSPRQLEKSLAILDLEKWERKALKRIQRGYDPACTFESEYIPVMTIAAIEGALESTTNKPDLVRDLFKNLEWVAYP